MRAIFVGASAIAIATARRLLKQGHDVVMIERNAELINDLSESLTCGFIHGDGSKPAILREADPKQSDILYCLTGNDQSNILASLVGRTLGYNRVVTQIQDPEYEHMCIELGLEELIIPARTISRFLADAFSGQNAFEISAVIKNEARVFAFVVHDEDAGPVCELKLPVDARAVLLYRGDQFEFIDDDTKLVPGDEVVVITHSKHLAKLHDMWKISNRT